MSEKQVDQHLVEQVKKGNKAAFDTLTRKYQYKIMNLVAKYINDHAEVQDVAQEAFIKAYRAINKFRGDSAFYTWLYRIAINTAKNYLVARGRRPPNSDIEASEAEQLGLNTKFNDSDTPEHELLTNELHQTIIDVVNKMPADLRMAITLREIEGLSYEEIAEIMECPIGTVRSRIFRARETIDTKIKPLID